MSEAKKTFSDKNSYLAEKNSSISPKFYEKYNVKRGLRNSDGTGVLVGLTEIGEVHGYILDEGEKTPDAGRLRYRGINVEDFVNGFFVNDKRFGFEESAYLLLFGELPDEKKLTEFKKELGEYRVLPEGFIEDMILKAPSPNIMNKLARGVLALYSYDENPDDYSINNILKQTMGLISMFPVLTAYAYQAKKHYYDNESLYIHTPQPELSTAENLLHLIRPDSTYTKSEARLLDLCLVLHAEHGGGNNSAFTIHVVSSSETDTYSAVSAAIGSLKGFKHGGANIKVITMMEDIKANVKDWKNETEVATYLEKIIRKEAFDKTGLVYGMGHAVYTLSDPRAVLLKDKAEDLAKEKGLTDEFNLYKLIERIAPGIFSKVKNSDKVISANVDFYSGFVYKMLNIPPELYTPIFAIARIAGWSAHRLEEIVSGGRIIRPAYKHVLPKREYTNIKDR